MRRHLTNAGFGALDYISYPLGMLLVAPVVLHRLGAAEYGLWMIATSVVSAGGIIASGFCDACTQRVAQLRAKSDLNAMPHAVQSMLAINVLFGSVLAFGTWIAAPYAAPRIAVAHVTPAAECLMALRIASVLILFRAMESVGVGVQRAFERYRETVQISTVVRLLTLAAAAVLAFFGFRTVSILAATGIFLVAGAFAQLRQASKLLDGASMRPRFRPGETNVLLRRGVFVWLQALGAVVFGQLDRILLGTYLGALVVAPYSLCVQFAHPIYGLTASALNFLFPYLSGRASTHKRAELRGTLLKAFACNAVLVACPAAMLLIFGQQLIRIWAGPAVAQSAAQILPPIVLGSAFVGLGVTGTYALQALGLFRTVAYISLVGRAAMLLLMVVMLRHGGLQGLATSRLFYGSIALLVYLPLLQQLRPGRQTEEPAIPLRFAREAQEGLKP
jgi:O-antigen/teichoic acid export membrane protein